MIGHSPDQDEIDQLREENKRLRGIIKQFGRVESLVKSLEEKLDSREHQFESLLSLMPVGIAICTDPSCREIRHNPAGSEFFRTTEWEILSFSDDSNPPTFTVMRDGAVVSPEEMPVQRSMWFGEKVEDRLDFIWDDGVRKCALVNSIPLTNQAGSIIGAMATIQDITEMKQRKAVLEAQTQLAEARYQEIEDIYNAVPVGLCLFDDQLRYVRLNQRVAEMNGVPIEEHIGRTVKQIVPDLTDQAERALQKIIQTGQPLFNFEIEGFTQAAPGKKRVWNSNWLPVRDTKGTINGLIVTAEEITERKFLEKQLQKYSEELEFKITERTQELNELNETLRISEERFKLALNNTATVLFTQDLALRYTWAYNSLITATAEEFLGKKDDELFAPEDAQCLTLLKHRVIDTGLAVRGEINTTNGGCQYWYDLYVQPLYENGFMEGITCVATDITKHKLALQKVEQAEERFSTLFYNSPIVLAITTLAHDRFIDVNDACVRALGHSREELLSSNGYQLDILVNPEIMHAHYGEFLHKGEDNSHEIKFRSAGGEIRTYLSDSEVINLNGEPCCLHSMIDITEQKLMEETIARLDRLNLVGEMAAGIGHEIRNPMTAVRGFLQMLSMEEKYQDETSYFNLMIEELDRANAIISEYLNLAKDKVVDLQSGSLDYIVTALYPVLMSDANLRGITIHLDLNDPPHTLIDANEIRQLLLNIVRNGMEAMSGPGTLTIGTRSEHDNISLYIKDQGHGLQPDIREKLGTPFITTKDHGTGLGLPICYSIAARHNASIDYETGPEGTTFNVRFPLPRTLDLPHQ